MHRLVFCWCLWCMAGRKQTWELWFSYSFCFFGLGFSYGFSGLFYGKTNSLQKNAFFPARFPKFGPPPSHMVFVLPHPTTLPFGIAQVSCCLQGRQWAPVPDPRPAISRLGQAGPAAGGRERPALWMEVFQVILRLQTHSPFGLKRFTICH